jgi:hypothetical protein
MSVSRFITEFVIHLGYILAMALYRLPDCLVDKFQLMVICMSYIAIAVVILSIIGKNVIRSDDWRVIFHAYFQLLNMTYAGALLYLIFKNGGCIRDNTIIAMVVFSLMTYHVGMVIIEIELVMSVVRRLWRPSPEESLLLNP